MDIDCPEHCDMIDWEYPEMDGADTNSTQFDALPAFIFILFGLFFIIQ